MAGLNPSEILEIIAIIRKIRDSGVTVLLIEHVMHAVMSLSDHIYVLSYGKIIAEGSPSGSGQQPGRRRGLPGPRQHRCPRQAATVAGGTHA